MERTWAQKAGLGWMGKHTLLINKQQGSYFFLAELIIDLPLPPDGPVIDYCGTCTRCIDACPTDAILGPYQLDASKCISYLTIELKEQIPQEFAGKMENWVFGCDICQDVCPWNRFSRPHQTPEFKPSAELVGMRKQDWEEITEEVFKQIFKDSPLKRTKLEGLQRNIAIHKHTP
jgi:epoxyqueuosine reductase